jgi:preprotein translocase subunit SecY
MIEKLLNIFRIPDLRKRVLFALGLLAVYRLGSFIPLPGIDLEALREFFKDTNQSIFGMVDLFTGGNFQNLTIFALGIVPYISASVILQLLVVVSPTLERLQKEGEAGRKKIIQWTRYGTIILAAVQAFFIVLWAQQQQVASGPIVSSPGLGFMLTTVLTLTAGTAFVMWLGEQITERGIGNGISLLIFAGIVAGVPSAFRDVLSGVFGAKAESDPFYMIKMIIVGAIIVATIAAVVLVERAQRRIPIQYASRVVGRRVTRSHTNFLPLKVNTAGVMPVIFATSLLVLPVALFQWASNQTQWGWLAALYRQLDYAMPLYDLVVIVMIVGFCFFYTSIIFNPQDTAENMKRVGGFIPGVRPGKQTGEYIESVLTRLTFAGAVYLGLLWLLPNLLMRGFPLHQIEPAAVGNFFDSWLPSFLKTGLGVTFYFGGTSLLIVVGVAMDTVQQIESQLVMRHYDGFLKGTRIKGRRG